MNIELTKDVVLDVEKVSNQNVNNKPDYKLNKKIKDDVVVYANKNDSDSVIKNNNNQNVNNGNRESKITKDMIIGDIVYKFSEAVPILFEMGFHCVGCGAMGFETLEQGFRAHGKTDEEIDQIIEQLNEVIKNGQ